uniref:RNA polymerase I-specific transcription initiation factor RRN3 n=1 Tax=Kalanchoe fedtschenkoi TaxID=63787 RepID=A0A7N0R8E2_KALFE
MMGDATHYQVIVNTLHRHESLSSEDIVDLEIILSGLSLAVSNIDLAYHSTLLNTIFGMSMWNYTPDVMDALVKLIISLAVASNGKLLDSCLAMLVANFVPPLSFQKLLNMPRGVTRKDQVLSHVHSSLGQISELVPLAPARLLTIIIQRMPIIMKSEHTILLYVENMLRLESGQLGEFIGSKMIMAVIDRLLDLDVEIEWDEANHDYCRREIFEMELDDMEEAPVIMNKKEDLHKYAEKLDSLMVMAFEHLNTCKTGGRLEKVFETLLWSFKTTVLNAYKSKFTQFVIFYTCSLDPNHCGKKFARTLASIFFDCGKPHISRMSAAAYLASYLARAKFLEFEFVADLLKSLVNWCLNYCQRFSATANKTASNFWGQRNFDENEISIMAGGVNPKAHRLFYAGCQAIMYVMCFQMRSYEELKDELFNPLNEVLNHDLSPLKVCLPTIVNEFLRQARGASVFTRMAEPASSYPEADELMFPDTFESDLSRAFGGMERLDMFFPFDPILLTKSDRFIRPQYVYWSSVKPTYVLDERCTSGEDDDSDHDDGIRDHDMAGSLRDSELLDECDQLNRMSVSSERYNNSLLDLQPPNRMPARIKPSMYPESF